MYRHTNVITGVWYLGIKKDKLPEDGGDPYWTSSKNNEFHKLIQGNEPIFILEIIDFRKISDYNYLQLKEYKMLHQIPNIKTNPDTYNLSYGIPPLGKDSLPSEKYLDWFAKQVKSGIWVDEDNPESVKALMDMFTYQPRAEDNTYFVNELAAELNIIGNNIAKMKPILIFEGVGEMFGHPIRSDVVVGTRHGLRAINKQKVLESRVCRVPYEILKDKSEYFLRALASHDNKNSDELVNKATWKDGSKLLVDLHDASGVDPKSDIARDQLKMVYNLKGYSISKAVGKAITDIKTGKKGKKWRDYFKPELTTMTKNADNESRIAMYMSSGKYDSKRIQNAFYYDQVSETGQKRTEMLVNIYHPDADAKDKFEIQFGGATGFKKELEFWTKPHGFKVDFKFLDHEIDDTENNYIDDDET